ncbi:hypothetical protein Bca52824_012457 [Brassica carinata]|uniref:Uncharacterized protein n=1 Tax=Brassica carinata TaxID=52824 RepID=A0A8X7VWH7_BRACI|nr:hypothetical protein Bca52824_012457 [Brassica carinata]
MDESKGTMLITTAVSPINSQRLGHWTDPYTAFISGLLLTKLIGTEEDEVATSSSAAHRAQIDVLL